MNSIFAINIINIEINEMTIFNINDEKIIILLFIYEIINVTICASKLNNVTLLKIFNVINLIIISYFIIYLTFLT